MVARVTLAEIDSVRTSVTRAVARFAEQVVPVLRGQHGYEGCYVFTSDEGKALVLTLWDDEEAAAAGVASGMYAATVEKFVTLVKTPPGRETYHVSLLDTPSA